MRLCNGSCQGGSLNMTQELKEFYEKIYKNNSYEYFVAYRNGKKLKESHIKILEILGSKKKQYENFLDFGCGLGEFLVEVAARYPKCKCTGIDFSPTAIKMARELSKNNISFIEGSFEKISDKCDCITSFGTLEHIDDPRVGFRRLYDAVKTNGTLIITCPNFSNVRGLIWMTLSKLFNVPMSLSDKHFFSPDSIINFLNGYDNYSMEIFTVDGDLSSGDYLLIDMKKRLFNALRDSKMDNAHVGELLDWIKCNLQYFPVGPYSGATAIYVIRKR